MTAIKLNNENKTEITFEYDNGLTYKERIRPKFEYGDLISDSAKAVIKVNLTKEEYKILGNKDLLTFEKFMLVTDEIWFDMVNVYMIIKNNNYLDQKVKNCDFIVSFYVENKKINGWGY